MKILLLPAYFYPELVSDTPLDDARYEAFSGAGMDMVLYTPTPTRSVSSEDKEKYKRVKRELLYNGKMDVHRFSMIDEGKNPIMRAWRYLLCFAKQYYYGCRQKGIDAIFVISTPPIQGMLAAFIKKRLHCKFIYNLQDIFPDTLAGAGLAKKDGLLWKIGRKIENFTYKNADKIIVISEDFKRNIMNKGVPEDKIEIVYNWVDEKAIQPVAKADNPLFEEFNLSRESFTVVYAGNLGNAQNLGIILDASQALPDVQFCIFGTGGLESDISARISNDNLQNIRLLPLQPYERVSYVYSLGDACVVSCKEGLGGSALPSKTWTIMSCGRPVIASFDEGELKETIEKNKCGVFSHAGSVNEFVSAVNQLKDNPKLCNEMGANAREFILSNLTKEVGTKKYVDIITKVVQE